jgi:NAD-dependent dihydropyrimidine dehydrogenase PreA subunit
MSMALVGLHVMGDPVFEKLADALNRLPNGFPRTQRGTEILILKRIFSPDEALIACQLFGTCESADTIAKRVGLSREEAASTLTNMAKRGLVWSDRKSENLRFRLAPFIVGIYEAQLGNMDHEFAHLVEQYLADGGLAGIMKPQPAIHRVVPAQEAVKTEWILPYDDVKGVLQAAKRFGLRDCICRVQKDQVGRECDFPTKMCLNFSSTEGPPRPNDISQKEALEILGKAEDIGLVHTVSNIMKGFGYICNCCGCCCSILRGITEFGIDNSVAHANYFAVIDPESCLGCGTCIERCQVHAIAEKEGIAVVERERCIGCGLCVTGCPNNVANLQRKPNKEIVDPPTDFAEWECERLRNRAHQ